MSPRGALIGSLLLALAAGCSSSSQDLPAGPEVLEKSSTAMRSVTSTHFRIKVEGELPDVAVKDAEGDLDAQGRSEGRAKVEQFGQLIEVEYVLVDSDLYFKGPTGGFTKLPAALAGQVYDPTAILDPERGVAKVLASAKDARTVSAEDGVNVVEATVPRDVVAGLVPGIDADVASRFSVKDDKLSGAVFTLPSGAKVAIDLAEFNKPVDVAPPA
ncbi:LppX_LprAFG lipoprotein [Saccharothrix coeruleofusca]|uniref:Lipoarabinomannan carrier protein LprG n=1 Tax=Saccharothrix coeruleofusca TaxID=33919 RepID=A0A918AMN2_9PSEU|nr:LppX_LprAFG lipoprotein [Saccharothrix coeruleofusca]MBP2341039.1 lipoprotein LprG [Saccharothrix coeruleofusca]GGP61637.1 lipoarabinomannan carrier protein LprG [Saccharothrix coeruleofusca]